MKELLTLYLMIVNVLVFLMYGMDKRKAKKKKWRIPESSLIFSAFLGGAFGALIGMHLFHHKTRHMQFRVMVPISVILWVGIIVYAFWFC